MGAPSARTYEHARHWVSLGHQVTVITGFPNHPTGIIRPEYRGYRVKRENVDGIDVLRTWVYVTPNKGFAKRILNFLSFFVSSLFFGATRTDRPDVVIGTSPQFFSAVSAYLLSVVKSVPFIFEVRDIWPQSAIELGALRNRLAIRFLEWLENLLYRKARLIVGVAESTRDYLLAKGIPSDRIAIIPNGVDVEFLTFERTITMPSELENKFIVSYIGTHGMSHALDVVLRAAKQLESDPKIHFLFVGEGAEKDNLLELAQKLELRNVSFLPEQPRESLIGFYKRSDVSLVPLKKLPIFSKVLPSKLFELMGTGTAIICSVEGEAADLVKSANAGLAIEPENTEALVAAITQLKTNPELLTRFRESGRRFVFEKYLRSNLAESYLQSIQSAIETGHKARSGNPMTSES